MWAELKSGASRCLLYFIRAVPEIILQMSRDISSYYEVPSLVIFHSCDERRIFTDAAGVELNGIAAAKAHAITHAPNERCSNWAHPSKLGGLEDDCRQSNGKNNF
jgi:hypothetical protein